LNDQTNHRILNIVLVINGVSDPDPDSRGDPDMYLYQNPVELKFTPKIEKNGYISVFEDLLQ